MNIYYYIYIYNPYLFTIFILYSNIYFCFYMHISKYNTENIYYVSYTFSYINKSYHQNQITLYFLYSSHNLILFFFP